MVTKKRNFKMEWAEIHLNTLDDAIAKFKSRPENIYRITPYDDLQRGLFCVKTESIADPIIAIRLGLISGDFISNLRASLDHLVWDITTKRTRDTRFPIYGQDTASAQAGISEATDGMADEAVRLVKEFQPYSYGDAYKSHPLWRLNRLWNIDKHQTITLHSMNSDVIAYVPAGIPVKEIEINEGKIMCVPLAAKDKVRLNPRPGVTILLGSEKQGIALTVPDLREMYQFVSGKVFPALASFIP